MVSGIFDTEGGHVELDLVSRRRSPDLGQDRGGSKGLCCDERNFGAGPMGVLDA